MRTFRTIESGYRMVGRCLAKSGVRLEESLDGKWVYVDILPDIEACESYVRNCNGRIGLPEISFKLPPAELVNESWSEAKSKAMNNE